MKAKAGSSRRATFVEPGNYPVYPWRNGFCIFPHMHVDQPMKTVFFYGLFMDQALLIEKGLNPASPRVARVDGYGLRIGERATLEESANERAFGVVMQLCDADLDTLYGAKSVADYIPVQVTAIDAEGNSIATISYILPMQKVSGRNAEYARSLADAATQIGLPEDYVSEIETWSK